MDMTQSIEPKSDQLNAEDLLTGPRTFTIEKVTQGSVEQPVNVHLVEFPGRPFRPSKTVRRLMVGAWGRDTAAYAGHRMTLYRDPAVRFGGQEVGGIRVSHMSGLDKRLALALTVTRGKRVTYTVEPLPDASPPAPPEPMTARTRGQLFALMSEQGWDDDTQRAWLTEGLGRPVESRASLTEDEALQAITVLRAPTQPEATQ